MPYRIAITRLDDGREIHWPAIDEPPEDFRLRDDAEAQAAELRRMWGNRIVWPDGPPSTARVVWAKGDRPALGRFPEV